MRFFMILLLFIKGIQPKAGNFLRSLRCSDTNSARFEGAADFEDFLDHKNASLVSEVTSTSLDVLKSTLEYLKPLPIDKSHLATVSPEYSQCAWLQVQFIGDSSEILEYDFIAL